jgi:hypothetical protein
VNAHYRVTPFGGVAAAMGDQVELSHAEGCTNHKLLPLLGLGGGFSVEYFNGPELAREPGRQRRRPAQPCERWPGPPATRRPAAHRQLGGPQARRALLRLGSAEPTRTALLAAL